MNESGVYEIRCSKVPGRYIGSTKRFKQRWPEHRYLLRRNKHHTRLLQEAWNTYGEEAFVFEIIEACPISALIVREQMFIDAYIEEGKRLFNTALIAGGPGPFSIETRARISRAGKGRICTVLTRAKRSIALRGRPNPNAVAAMAKARIGIPRPPETRAKISKALAGRGPSPEAIAKAAALNTGKVQEPEVVARRVSSRRKNGPWFSDDTKKKMSESHKGKPLSAETRAKISAGHQRRSALRREQKSLLELAAK